jgi:hypothetical protein
MKNKVKGEKGKMPKLNHRDPCILTLIFGVPSYNTKPIVSDDPPQEGQKQ